MAILAIFPAASKLGAARGLCCSEEKGIMEKFRPFGAPPTEWDGVRAAFGTA